MVSQTVKQGYKLVSKKFPDFEKEQFDKPIQVELGFKNEEDNQLFSYQEIFFTDKGFMVQVIADDAEELEALTKFAKTIKPKKTDKE